MPATGTAPQDFVALAANIKAWGHALGFQHTGISGVNLGEHEAHLLNWLSRQRHGVMDYMARHGTRRSRPAELVPGTLRVIAVRMDYLPGDAVPTDTVLHDPGLAFVSRYDPWTEWTEE